MTKFGVVLGASTGTGAAIAKALAWPMGDHQVLGFHRGWHPKEAVEMERDRHVEMAALDVGTNFEAVSRGLTHTKREFGRQCVSVFVHALSGASVGAMKSISAEQVEKTFAAQAHSFLWWAQGLYHERLLAPNATLIALSNPVVENYLSGSGVIGPAKAALEAYVKGLAVELGRDGHRVLCVRFGAVMTPAFEKVVPGAAAKMTAVHHSISPVQRMQTAEEIGKFVAVLVDKSEETAALNGAVVDFTFGAHLTLMDHAFSGGR
jgi:NAD(P)-dependent dehydrogenase (short-subunit alcohol dehydrogenase family)